MAEQAPTQPFEPAFVPFQLSDEMYAQIIRDPAHFGYPQLGPEAQGPQMPKYGHIYVWRCPGQKCRKDGYDWLPRGGASCRVLRDGETELHRLTASRRTKQGRAAKPLDKSFFLFQRAVWAETKEALETSPGEYVPDLTKIIGARWRAMSAEEKAPYGAEAHANNRLVRQRMADADPAELLVCHEIWLRKCGEPRYGSFKGRCVNGTHCVIVHYLGDDAFQQLSVPPPPDMFTAMPMVV